MKNGSFETESGKTTKSGPIRKTSTAKAKVTIATVSTSLPGSAKAAMEESAITQALGLTHWKAAAAQKPMGSPLLFLSPNDRDMPIDQAIQSR